MTLNEFIKDETEQKKHFGQVGTHKDDRLIFKKKGITVELDNEEFLHGLSRSYISRRSKEGGRFRDRRLFASDQDILPHVRELAEIFRLYVPPPMPDRSIKEHAFKDLPTKGILYIALVSFLTERKLI